MNADNNFGYWRRFPNMRWMNREIPILEVAPYLMIPPPSKKTNCPECGERRLEVEPIGLVQGDKGTRTSGGHKLSSYLLTWYSARFQHWKTQGYSAPSNALTPTPSTCATSKRVWNSYHPIHETERHRGKRAGHARIREESQGGGSQVCIWGGASRTRTEKQTEVTDRSSANGFDIRAML
jgi:hypothetical protein